MRYWRRHPGLRVCLSAVVLLSQAACAGWTVPSVPPATAISNSRPKEVRLTRIDGSEVVLQRPFMRGDTIFGVPAVATPGMPAPIPGGVQVPDTSRSPDTVGVALGDVRATRIRSGNPGGTALLIVGAGLGVVLLFTLMESVSNLGGDYWQ